ncbi:P-type Mg2+ transporter [Entomortierella parvispora]|uniref:Magnesium-transporting ATPase, P-type 1 n=1 Tax=Entomortierella parvispora TaxID=205924 RepID=A0A9P3HF71_9FUNG|nr:P-type Mg2+ transporter [Entomortierella parvispora]
MSSNKVNKKIEALKAHHGVVYENANSVYSVASIFPPGSEFEGLLPLNDEQAARSQEKYGKNVISFGEDLTWYRILFHASVHPFNILLVVLAAGTIATGSLSGGVIMFVMVFISTVLRFWQEWKSASAAQALKSMVSTLITVTRLYSAPEGRDPTPEDVARIVNNTTVQMDITIEDVAPGDWVQLSAGDLIPADVRVLESKDLFVSQAALTGEAMPVEKFSSSSEAMAHWSGDKQNSYDDMAKEAVPMDATATIMEKESVKTLDATSKAKAKPEAKGKAMRAIYACFGVRYFAPEDEVEVTDAGLDRPDICFMGTSVVSGTATVLVEKTGENTFFGSMAKELSKRKPENAFQLGVRNISWVFFGMMFVLIPPVLLINGLTTKGWTEAVLFALSVAVGLTPEMLPMIVNSNLARGAWLMSKKRCIVKNLDAIINLGSMDVLCTDKTGTLTDNRVVLVRHLDFMGNASMRSLQFAFLNSRFQTGLKNLLDVAVVEYFEKTASALPMYESLSEDGPAVGSGLTPAAVTFASRYLKLDEIPFDFVRRRMSVIIKDLSDDQTMMVSKGAVEEMLRICTKIVLPRQGSEKPSSDIIMGTEASENVATLDLLDRPAEDQIQTLTPEMIAHLMEMNKDLNVDGLRVVAVAYKNITSVKDNYGLVDECDMVFAGLIGFLDPPKESSAPAIKELMSLGVEVKVLTGDSAAVCRKVCQQINLPINSIVTTDDLIGLDDEQLAAVALKATIFAKLTPLQKSQVIRALKRSDRVVGFLGDGINDAPALSEADIGISVDTATDIAKESAQVILLEKSLTVIAEAVVLGRTTYGNTMKYIVMAISSNFGNVFSMLIASAWLPFLPMLPIHILVQNLMYDLSQTTIPWDRMDPEFLKVPHRWSMKSILRFMVFMGPWSSPFDITTFLFMWFHYGIQTIHDDVTMFQTAWFIEGSLTQLLVIHIIRTPKIPFLQSMAAWPIVASSILFSTAAIAIPYIPFFQDVLTLEPPPGLYYVYLIGALLTYFTITQAAKLLYLRVFKTWF